MRWSGAPTRLGRSFRCRRRGGRGGRERRQARQRRKRNMLDLVNLEGVARHGGADAHASRRRREECVAFRAARDAVDTGSAAARAGVIGSGDHGPSVADTGAAQPRRSRILCPARSDFCSLAPSTCCDIEKWRWGASRSATRGRRRTPARGCAGAAPASGTCSPGSPRTRRRRAGPRAAARASPRVPARRAPRLRRARSR
jgi:hypothetical protein